MKLAVRKEFGGFARLTVIVNGEPMTDAISVGLATVRINHVLETFDLIKNALADLVEIERRDALLDPALTATDRHREATWNEAKRALAIAAGVYQ